MKISQAKSKRARYLALGIAGVILFSGTSTNAVTSPSPKATPTPNRTPTPSPTPTPTPTQALPTFPKVAPVYADTKVPLIKSITSSTEKVDGQFNFGIQMTVRIHRNTLISASVVLSPKTLDKLAVDPIFMAPCAKFNSISLSTLTPSGDLTSLQSRIIDGDWFVETHVFTSVTKLPEGQDICPGQYVISTINLVDAAKHTLTISANLASTAPVINSANKTPTTGTSTSRTTYNDVPAQTSNIWTNYLELAACPQAVNVNPIVTVIPGKTTTVNGRSTTTPPTTKTEIPTTPAALRTTCDHSADFAKAYLSVVPSTASGGAGETRSTGSTLLPVVDYASKTKVALDENVSMKKQLEVLTKKVDGLSRTIEIYKNGGLPSNEKLGEDGTAVVDYQAKAKALQAKVTSLTKQLKALKASKAPAKPSAQKPKTITQPSTRATPQQTRGGSGGWRGNASRSPTPKPSTR